MDRFFYSRDALLAQRLRDFASFGRNGSDTHTLFSAYPTETNDGRDEEIFAVQMKLPPFRGRKKLVRGAL